MAHQFQKHYTRAEARALLPQVRKWLKELSTLRGELQKQDKALSELMTPGRDLGGPVVNAWARAMSHTRALLLEFYRRQIQIKDLDRGLIDFPALKDDHEVFLCWEEGEEDIEFWHDLESGYSGRQKLDEFD